MAFTGNATIELAVLIHGEGADPVLTLQRNLADRPGLPILRVDSHDVAALLVVGNRIQPAIRAEFDIAHFGHIEHAQGFAGLRIHHGHLAEAAEPKKDHTLAGTQAARRVGSIGVARKYLSQAQIGAAARFPCGVTAGLRVDAIETARRILSNLVPDIDRSLGGGHQAGGGNAATNLFPQDVAVRVAGQQRLGALTPTPTQIHALVIGGGRTRVAMVRPPDVAPRRCRGTAAPPP